jgi:hypothetical protein
VAVAKVPAPSPYHRLILVPTLWAIPSSLPEYRQWARKNHLLLHHLVLTVVTPEVPPLTSISLDVVQWPLRLPFHLASPQAWYVCSHSMYIEEIVVKIHRFV